MSGASTKLKQSVRRRIGRRAWQLASTALYRRLRLELEARVAAGAVRLDEIDRWQPQGLGVAGR